MRWILRKFLCGWWWWWWVLCRIYFYGQLKPKPSWTKRIHGRCKRVKHYYRWAATLNICLQPTFILVCTLSDITEVCFIVRIMAVAPYPLCCSIRVAAIVMWPYPGMVVAFNTTLYPGLAPHPTLCMLSSSEVFGTTTNYTVKILPTKVLERKY